MHILSLYTIVCCEFICLFLAVRKESLCCLQGSWYCPEIQTMAICVNVQLPLLQPIVHIVDSVHY